MRNFPILFLCTILALGAFSTVANAKLEASKPEVKEWTLLVYLNGNNNLDSFGKMNLNQMEKVGSTNNVNIVVQWASLKNKKTQRLYVVKDTDTVNVTSPILQNMGKVDMGDYRSLVEFVRWGVENFPAKHYFVDVWDHGSGWHLFEARHARNANFTPSDISWDDNTGNFISTEQLGMALTESAKIIGHKVDIYGSDACLMAMAEVAGEMSDSVQVLSGSEETEPGEGWPYDQFLNRLNEKPTGTPQEVGAMLAEEYLKAYSGGQFGKKSVTLSALDLTKMDAFNAAVAKLGQSIAVLPSEGQQQVVKIAGEAQNYAFSDYVDLGDFVQLLSSVGVAGLDGLALADVQDVLKKYVVTVQSSPRYSRSTGVSIWLPTDAGTFHNHADRYEKLKFNVSTQWGSALKALLE